jgi:hypothetical protein
MEQPPQLDPVPARSRASSTPRATGSGVGPEIHRTGGTEDSKPAIIAPGQWNNHRLLEPIEMTSSEAGANHYSQNVLPAVAVTFEMILYQTRGCSITTLAWRLLVATHRFP